jgi:hypothetical protein
MERRPLSPAAQYFKRRRPMGIMQTVFLFEGGEDACFALARVMMHRGVCRDMRFLVDAQLREVWLDTYWGPVSFKGYQ